MEAIEETAIESARIREYLPRLHAGERILLSGDIYTVRDAAHRRLWNLMEKGQPLPFPIEDAVFYYASPAPARGDMATGACGPTTARRMDAFTPRLLSHGLAATIGKGDRSEGVEIAIREHAACHFAAVGGAGALLAQCIQSAQVVAFPDLGCEAVYRMHVKDFPLLVAIDCRGGNLYRTGKSIYRQV